MIYTEFQNMVHVITLVSATHAHNVGKCLWLDWSYKHQTSTTKGYQCQHVLYMQLYEVCLAEFSNSFAQGDLAKILPVWYSYQF